jgi:hypothetical protein
MAAAGGPLDSEIKPRDAAITSFGQLSNLDSAI